MKIKIQFPLTFYSQEENVWECFDNDGMFLFETCETDGVFMRYLVEQANAYNEVMNSKKTPFDLFMDKEDSYEV
jgi:hypothetical protein